MDFKNIIDVVLICYAIFNIICSTNYILECYYDISKSESVANGKLKKLFYGIILTILLIPFTCINIIGVIFIIKEIIK